ncbi:MAG: division/cell wall cluster transcriptional repressor MraZ [Pseudomonadota bacterium]|nr:division/cell wall cluster transcriptional repressor MraZ [Pseudomonadota bacterium]
MAFRGRFEYSLDSKGRLNIPAKFRDILVHQFNSELVITTALGNILDCYPLAKWIEIEEKLNALPSSRVELKSFKRLYVSGAVECSLDKQGRVLLPPTLRSWAGLDQKDNSVVIAGMIDKLEIFSRERWVEEEDGIAKTPEEIAKTYDILGEYGLSI